MKGFEGIEQYPIDLWSLPSGWAVSSLENAGCDVESGFASGKHNSDGDGVPHLRPMNVSREGRIDLDVLKSVATDASAKRLHRGDVLFNNTNSPALVGKTAFFGLDGDWAYSNHMTRVAPWLPLDGEFLAHQLHYCWATGYFGHICTNHVNQASISSKRLAAAVPVVVPPFAEQRRIVSAIEEHFSRLDAADNLFGSIYSRIARLREAAVEAALAGDWPVESLSSRTTEQRYGSSAKASEHGDVPVLRMGNIQHGRLDYGNLKYLPSDHPDVRELRLRHGDLLFNRTNSAELVGKSAVFRETGSPVTFASYLIRARLDDTLDPEWASIHINSRAGRQYIDSVVTQQVGQANVNGTKLKNFPIPVPPIEVQRSRIAHLDEQRTAIDDLQAQIERARRKLAALRRSILSAAFTGRLVPQDPADLPASVLLERIAAERAAAKPSRRKGAAS